mgnify:CR=1 FL=1
MKKIFPNLKTNILIITSFVIILVNSFLCYLISPLRNNNGKFLPLLLPFIAIFFALTIFLIVFLQKKMNYEFNIFILFFVLCLISGTILTFVFKIVTVVNQKSILSKTGFISIIILAIYYICILITSYLPIQKIKNKKHIEITEI